MGGGFMGGKFSCNRRWLHLAFAVQERRPAARHRLFGVPGERIQAQWETTIWDYAITSYVASEDYFDTRCGLKRSTRRGRAATLDTAKCLVLAVAAALLSTATTTQDSATLRRVPAS